MKTKITAFFIVLTAWFFGVMPIQAQEITENFEEIVEENENTAYIYMVDGDYSNDDDFVDRSLENPTYNQSGSVTWNCVWFGNYWQEDTDNNNVVNSDDSKQPIKWRILERNGSDLFLISDKILDCMEYGDIPWKNSTIRSWLNQDFLTSAFTGEEQNKIINSTVDNSGNEYFNTPTSDDTNDKIYLLSITEITSEQYGFKYEINDEKYGDLLDSDVRAAAGTNYAISHGLGFIINNNSSNWLLRSNVSGNYTGDYVRGISTGGRLYKGWPNFLNSTKTGIRPVLHLNISGNCWEYAGTVCSDGTVNEIPYLAGEQNPVENQSQIIEALINASNIAYNIYMDPPTDYVDKTQTKMLPYSYSDRNWEFWKVVYPEWNSVEGVRTYIKKYFTESCIEGLMEGHDWTDTDDGLYVSATDGIGDFEEDHVDVDITKVSDTEYRLNLKGSRNGIAISNYTVYCKLVDGNWVFDNYEAVLTAYNNLDSSSEIQPGDTPNIDVEFSSKYLPKLNPDLAVGEYFLTMNVYGQYNESIGATSYNNTEVTIVLPDDLSFSRETSIQSKTVSVGSIITSAVNSPRFTQSFYVYPLHKERFSGEHKINTKITADGFPEQKDGSFTLADLDGDGLLDEWELNGHNYATSEGTFFFDFPAMGADVYLPDIYVEVDWMEGLKPQRSAILTVINQFAKHGMNLHVDMGSAYTIFGTVDTPWGDMSKGGDTIPYKENLNLYYEDSKGEIVESSVNCDPWQTLADKYFKLDNSMNKTGRENVFRYCIIVDKFNTSAKGDWNTGLADGAPGKYFLVAECTRENDTMLAGTFMHELGHTLGLHHGGNDDLNGKPNYLSIMNYLFQFSGLVGTNEVNYSDYKLPSLDEKHLDESKGIDPEGLTRGSGLGTKWYVGGGKESPDYKNIAATNWIDYNFNHLLEKDIVLDLNQDGRPTELPQSINDWMNLDIKGGFTSEQYIKGKDIIMTKDSLESESELSLKEAEELHVLTNEVQEETDLSYSIMLDGNGSDFGIVDGLVNLELGKEYNIPLNTFTNDGYVFKCWNTKRDGSGYTYNDGGVVTVSVDRFTDRTLTLYAQWTEAQNPTDNCLILFNSYGGSYVPYMTTCSGTCIPQPVLPTRDGYTFIGWYKDEDLTSQWNFATDTVADSMILYAKWKINGVTEEPLNSETAVMLAVKEKYDISNYMGEPYDKFTIDNTKLATVTKKGLITAKKPGTVTVTGYKKSGRNWIEGESAVVQIVKPFFAKKTIDARFDGQTLRLYDYLVDHSYKTPDEIISSNEKVAFLTGEKKNTIIHIHGKGTAKITVKYGEGKNAAKYSITVKASFPTMSKANLKIQTGQSAVLTLKNTKLIPEWDGGGLVTIDDTGKLTAISAGEGVISATVEGVIYSCNVKVVKPVIKKKAISVKVGGTGAVGLKNTKLKNIEWVSDDTSIATVDEKGRVKGISKGTTTIRTFAGNVENSCTVTVK